MILSMNNHPSNQQAQKNFLSSDNEEKEQGSGGGDRYLDSLLDMLHPTLTNPTTATTSSSSVNNGLFSSSSSLAADSSSLTNDIMSTAAVAASLQQQQQQHHHYDNNDDYHHSSIFNPTPIRMPSSSSQSQPSSSSFFTSQLNQHCNETSNNMMTSAATSSSSAPSMSTGFLPQHPSMFGNNNSNSNTSNNSNTINSDFLTWQALSGLNELLPPTNTTTTTGHNNDTLFGGASSELMLEPSPISPSAVASNNAPLMIHNNNGSSTSFSMLSSNLLTPTTNNLLQGTLLPQQQTKRGLVLQEEERNAVTKNTDIDIFDDTKQPPMKKQRQLQVGPTIYKSDNQLSRQHLEMVSFKHDEDEDDAVFDDDDDADNDSDVEQQHDSSVVVAGAAASSVTVAAAAAAASRSMSMNVSRRSSATMDSSTGSGVSSGTSGTRFRDYQSEQWTEKFDQLCQYVKSNGHCQVTSEEDKSLSRWLKRQRYQYKLKKEGKSSTMTQERISALNNLTGFVWNSHCAIWEERLADLMSFQRKHGHVIVPSQYPPNQKLATWVKCQRRQYKLFLQNEKSNMTIERIQRLNKMGFVWELRCHPPKK